MRYAILVMMVLLNGCASVLSDYNRGCRDGAATYGPTEDAAAIAADCDRLDAKHATEVYRSHSI